MKLRPLASSITAALMAFSALIHAAVPFKPLDAPAQQGETDEATHPFKLPAGWNQSKLIDVAALDAKFNGNYPESFRNFDMIDFSANGKLLFIPHEVAKGAGVTRVNLENGAAHILLQGNNTGVFETNPLRWSATNDDFGSLDPALITPWGTLLTAEEGAGRGRMFELLNPSSATRPYNARWRWLNSIPSVAHEGLKFDRDGNLYFIDEDKSGSLYKFVPSTARDLSAGQVFVLKVDAYEGDALADWDDPSNTNQRRTGLATWLPMTDANGVALTSANPFDYAHRGGRVAADELGATPFGRPEDVAIGYNPNSGKQVIYFSATSERIVYAVELRSASQALVSEFVNAYVTPDTLGNVPVGPGKDGAYGITAPDNLVTDKVGNVWIVEDQNPGDIWFVKDLEKDGSAASVALFASLGVDGSEPSGLIIDRRDPFKFYVNVQHPSSDNDAVWTIYHDLSDACACGTDGTRDAYLTCVSQESLAMMNSKHISATERAGLIRMAMPSVCKQ